MPRPGGAGRQPPPRASSSGLSNHSTVWLILEKSSFNFSTHPFTWQNTILFYFISGSRAWRGGNLVCGRYRWGERYRGFRIRRPMWRRRRRMRFAWKKTVICLTIVWNKITQFVTFLGPFSLLVSPLGHCLIH